MAASQESVRLLGLFALQNGQGPCRDCFATGHPVLVDDLDAAATRWPVFTPHALSAGFHSVCAIPMRHGGNVIGTVNLFGTRRGQISPEDVRIVQALTHAATIGILQEQALRRGELLTEQLQNALNSRIVIEQAKGAVAQLHGVDIDDAFALLRDYSRARGLPMVEVAAAVVGNPEEHPELTQPGGRTNRSGGRDRRPR
ncbi:MAG: GAF and ANTAR domain-containing protein [Ornithinimicrobium sp.]|uniref:GAF and ANTAR domain-containing protein n=1 Tax=Ornithinimicrobium sp. TaxID=1977084 RepID=UPI003D9B626A